jgi:glutamyl/glutaminyl-tRNA synthetase
VTERPETFAQLLRTRFPDEALSALCVELGIRETLLERMRKGVTRCPRHKLREALARVLDVPVDRVTAAVQSSYAERRGDA